VTAIGRTGPDTEDSPPILAEAGFGRLRTIDILRALAALMVVLYHARAEYWVGLRETWETHGWHTLRPDIWLAYASGIFSLGWLGVPIFFVLSGYCIHRTFAAKLRDRPETALVIGAFYKRRFLRIYPVYVAALLLTAAVDYIGDPANPHFEAWVGQNISNFALNLLMGQELFVRSFGSNGVFWTLSIEFHLYLFYPFLFLIFRRHGPKVALGFAAMVSFLTSLIYWRFDLGHVFVHMSGGSPLFTSHLFLWTSGAYLAEVHAGRAPMPRGIAWHAAWIAALGIGIVLQNRGAFGWSPLFLAIGTPGLLAVTLSALARLCRNGGMIVNAFYLVGIASYSLYATHAPVFHTINLLTGHYRSQSILWPLACTLVAVAFALLFFYLIERHTIRSASRSAPRPI